MTANQEESEFSMSNEPVGPTPSNWVRVGIVAAASALAGGLAAAWWYRKTIQTLRQNGEIDSNPNFGISSDEPDYDI